MNCRLHLVIHGIVQGVGYRYSTYKKALQMGLTGWVRNRSDGAVEAVFEGPREKLEEILHWCYIGPIGACVSNIDVQWEEGNSKFVNFEIRFK
ncbi:MAG TPA: acylphosphatase [Candidatus Hydrogenedens sp.]|nr:acylphosphatase [Candidatus Hydrogenedens sp.]